MNNLYNKTEKCKETLIWFEKHQYLSTDQKIIFVFLKKMHHRNIYYAKRDINILKNSILLAMFEYSL